jgi:GH15 family glucan-1,4-alpha-glucosidase
MLTPLDFGAHGEATARMIIGAGSSSDAALAALRGERQQAWGAELAAVTRYWRGWLAGAPLPAVPANNPEASRIQAVAKRSLITMRLAVDPGSAAIVASGDTQGPYGEDWIRDGSFIDEALDEAGYHNLVSRHEQFEVSAQTTATNPDVLRPSGNWPMATYGDGVPGGPIPYEIDETGFGAWTLWQHSTFLSPVAARTYLQQVFPAIARAADWITACQDPLDGLQCQANEDDNLTPTQTLHGAGPDLLGLRSAILAAGALGLELSDPRVAQWSARAGTLQQAIDKLWLPSRGVYGEGAGDAGASSPATPNETQLFSDGGWLLWPVQLHSMSATNDPVGAQRMASEANATLAAALDSLGNQASGGYEAKGLLGACKSLPGLPAAAQTPARAQLQRAVGMLASSSASSARGFTTDTGLFAEFWQVFGAGSSAHVVPLNDAPHVWEHALYYMTALCAFGVS